jgi:hypothetical protein
MNLVLAAIGIAAVAGAVVAVSSRQARVAILGLVVALVAVPVIADPRPDILPLAGRLLAALLSGYLLWITARSEATRVTAGSRLGWPVEALAAAAAGVVGFGTASSGSLPEAQAAGFALAVLAVGPVVRQGDPLRLAVGLLLLVTAATLVLSASAGAASPIGQLLIAGLIVLLTASMAPLAAARRPTEPAGVGGRATAPAPAPGTMPPVPARLPGQSEPPAHLPAPHPAGDAG